TTIEAWGQVLTSSGQHEALRDGQDDDLDFASTTSVLDAVGTIWCAFYPQIEEASDGDVALTLTYLALGSATNATEAIEGEPSAGDQIRVQQFESLTAQYEQQLAQTANAGTGSVSAEGWTHPVPG